MGDPSSSQSVRIGWMPSGPPTPSPVAALRPPLGSRSAREFGLTTPPTRQVLPVSVLSVRFSQCTVSGPTRLHREEVALTDLIAVFTKEGYVSQPIQVVRMLDDGFTSLDNRRLFAANTAGLDTSTQSSTFPTTSSPVPRGNVVPCALRATSLTASASSAAAARCLRPRIPPRRRCWRP